MLIAFTDLFEDVTKEATKIPTDKYLFEGKYQIIDQGQKEIAGYTNTENGLFTNIPAIIFGDHTRVIKYIDKPLFLGADGVKLLRAKIANPNYKYLYYALKWAKIPDTGYNRHYKWLKEISINVPNEAEQQKIVSILDQVNHIISLRSQQLEQLDLFIKSRFVEMFGDIIINSKNWKTDLLGNISESRLGKMLDIKQQTGENMYPYLANFNVQWFYFDLSKLNNMDFNEAERIEFCLEKGDLLVTEGGEVGRCAIWNNEIEKCYFQKALHRVRCNKSIITPLYLANWFKFHNDFNKFEDIVCGQSTIPHLTGVKLKNLIIPLPPLSLQNQFAEFVEEVEQNKTTIKQSLSWLNTLKSKLMQDYFG